MRDAVTITQTLAYIGMPTNWHAWSPTRNRHGWGRAWTETSTVSYVISTTNAGTVTNTVWDAFGVETTISGTNGQRVTVSPVASPILPGFNSHDYGYRDIPRAFNAVSWPWLPVDSGVGGDLYRGDGDSTNSYAEAVDFAEVDYAGWLSGWVYCERYGFGVADFGGSGIPAYSAKIIGTDAISFNWNEGSLESEHGNAMAVSTGRVYVIGAANPPLELAPGTTRVLFDAQGSSFTGTNTLHLIFVGESAVTNSAAADMSIFNNGDMPPNQPSEPSGGDDEVRGWMMNDTTVTAFLIPTNYYSFIDPYADVAD
jgi:hypothetical protein